VNGTYLVKLGTGVNGTYLEDDIDHAAWHNHHLLWWRRTQVRHNLWVR
jgi:hypothetical protein